MFQVTIRREYLGYLVLAIAGSFLVIANIVQYFNCPSLRFSSLFIIQAMTQSMGMGIGELLKSLQNKKGLQIFQLPTFRCLFLSCQL